MVWMCFILHSWIFLTKIASLLNLFDFKKKSSIYFMSKLKHYFGDQLITRENLIFQEFKCINFNKNWQISNFCNQTHTYQNGKGNKKYWVYHLPSNLYKEASGLSRQFMKMRDHSLVWFAPNLLVIKSTWKGMSKQFMKIANHSLVWFATNHLDGKETWKYMSRQFMKIPNR